MLLSTVLSFQPKEFPSALLVGQIYKSDELRQLEFIEKLTDIFLILEAWFCGIHGFSLKGIFPFFLSSL